VADAATRSRRPFKSRRSRSFPRDTISSHCADGHGKDSRFRSAYSNEAGCVEQKGQRRVPRALVVAPTRELVVQIEENVARLRETRSIAHGHGFRRVSERPQIEALRSGVDLVVATPGRLIDLMDQRVANLSGVEFLVLDEADRMLDMGFLPPIRRIVKALPAKTPDAHVLRLASREIEQLTHQFQQSPKIVQIGRRANPAETVTQLAYEGSPALEICAAAALVRRSKIRYCSCFYPYQAWRRQDRSRLETAELRRHDPFQSLAEPAAPCVEGFQIRRGPCPRRHGQSPRGVSTWMGSRMW